MRPRQIFEHAAATFLNAWPRIERLGLAVSGLATASVGILLFMTGFAPKYATTLRDSLIGSGVVVMMAGLLAMARRRQDLVVASLSAIAAAAFAMALAVLTTAASPPWQNLDVPLALGGCLLGVIAFRGAFHGGIGTSFVEPAARGRASSKAPTSQPGVVLDIAEGNEATRNSDRQLRPTAGPQLPTGMGTRRQRRRDPARGESPASPPGIEG